MQAQKTKFFNTTPKERPEFFLHEPGNGPAALLLPVKKRFQLLRKNTVENSRFGAARGVFKRGARHASARYT